MIHPFFFHKLAHREPWAIFFTTASTPNPVQFITRMPTGESLFFDWGDGSAVQEVVGTGADQTTQHTYVTPVAGTEITINDDDDNRFQMLRFNIGYQYLDGDCPDFRDFSDIVLINLRNNSFDGQLSAFDNCNSFRYLYFKLTPFSGEFPVISGNTDAREVYADQGGGFTGNIPSLADLPGLSVFTLYSNAVTGFSGGFTPLASRNSSLNFRVFNNQLTETAVNLILADARAAEFGTGDNFELGGTGNAAPTGQGLIDKQWLIDNGCTVSTN